MERNPNDTPGTSSDAGAPSGGAYDSGAGYGNAGNLTGSAGYGAGAAGAGAETTGTEGTRSFSEPTQTAGTRERLADIGSTVKEKAVSVGSTVRESVGGAKDSLADYLESGADKLRHRANTGTTGATADLAMAGAAGGTASAATDTRMAQVSDKVAGGMQATADWLRDADLEGLKTGVERQVKEHPARTLLIALGVGYLLGKSIKR